MILPLIFFQFYRSSLQDDRYLVDITGHQIDWYNSEDGWTDQRRHNVLRANNLMMENIKKVPSFTKYGYKKMSIPNKLHHHILKSFNLNSSKLTDEIMHERDPLSSGQEVINNGITGKIQVLHWFLVIKDY